MAINLDETEIATREHRLGSLTGYRGTAKQLITQVSCCGAENKERCFSQAGTCSSAIMQGYLAGIADAIVVNHGPSGCASDAMVSNVRYHFGKQVRGERLQNVGVFTTNMNKEDTVFGATEKLKDTIREAFKRYKPKAVFVTTSCVSGIIGEDIKGALDEIREEIPVPVAPVFCEGFKSRVWASGWDSAFHAIVKYIVKVPEKKTNKINVINFRPSATRKEFTEMLRKLGFEPTYVVPFCTVRDLAGMAEAAATVTVCETLSTYIGTALEQEYGVPYIRSIGPQGVEGFDTWLRELGKATGREEVVEAYLEEEKRKTFPELAEIKKKLLGCRAVVGMGAVMGHDCIKLLQELGVEVVWSISWHYDTKYDGGNYPQATEWLAENKPDLPVSVSDMQDFEVINILHTLKPDIYVCRHPGVDHIAVKMGVATFWVTDLYLFFGYRGLVNIGNKILSILSGRRRNRIIGKHIKLPYTDWWFQQDSFSFLGKEK